MRYSTFSALIFLSIALLAQAKTSCPNDCHGRGWCLADGTCKCFQGYHSTSNNDCEDTPYNTGREVLWILMRTLFAFSFFVLFVLSMFGLYTTVHSGFNKSATVLNIRKTVLAIMSAYSAVSVLTWSIDPNGYAKIVPLAISKLLTNTPTTLLTSMFIIILFHWIELYYVTITSLRKEEMIKQINSAYQGTVTLEDILSKVQFFRKMRIPFLILVIIIFVVQIIQDISIGLHVRFGYYLGLLYSLLIVLTWLVTSIGYLIYGRKLLKLMPSELHSTLKRATTLLTIISAMQLIIISVSLIYGFASKSTVVIYMASSFTATVLYLVNDFILLSVFMKWNSRFPFCFTFGDSTRRTPDDSRLAYTGSEASVNTGSNEMSGSISKNSRASSSVASIPVFTESSESPGAYEHSISIQMQDELTQDEM